MIGTVLQIQGSWRVAAGAPPLIAGEGVPAGARITASSAKKTDFLTVVLLDGRRLTAVCTADPCTTALQAPSNYADAGTNLQHIMEAVKFVLLNRRPEVINAFSSTSSRGGDSVRAEMVAPFESGKPVQLNSVFPRAPKGDYTLDLKTPADDQLLSSTAVHWRSPSEPVLLRVPKPGSYIVYVQAEYEDTVGNIFLSVVAPSAYGRIKNSLEEAQAICAKWTGPDASASAHFFLRAYLLALTAQE